MKNHLVIGGQGEVGSALVKVLREKFIVQSIDRNETINTKFDYVHITIPNSVDFFTTVSNYKELYLKTPTSLLIIHSTVPVGTCRKLDAVHSPIRGMHPNMYQGIKTFIKYFGGNKAKEAAASFEELGIRTFCDLSPETTEALKLWDTLQYGMMIAINKEIKNWCDVMELNFETIYSHANQTYNEGYEKLGQKKVQRPILQYIPGPIGGHCVIPNAHLLNSSMAEWLLEKNLSFY